jgi:hypothetical protein
MRAVLTVAAMIAAAQPAAGDPVGSRVLTAPTAWLPANETAAVTLGLDHRRDGLAIASYGLGGLAEIELGADTDVRACADCTARPIPLWLGRAGFRLGARQDAWFTGMPAVVLGVRTAFAAHGHAVHGVAATDAYVVASRDLGVLRLHAGIDALAASVDGHRSAAELRPLAGIELHPPMYPRSSLLGDIAWQPELDAARGPALGWLLGIGVRYQAFAWASVELAVRARQGEDLGGSTVLVRVNAMTQR